MNSRISVKWKRKFHDWPAATQRPELLHENGAAGFGSTAIGRKLAPHYFALLLGDEWLWRFDALIF
jgi:hypothetical protein